MLSFWEKRSFVEYDHVVIGSGIVGLSTAISIREKQPEASVLVLEKGLFPTGASTKNAGFACFGSLTELLEDIQIMGEEKALELVRLRVDGLNKLRNRLGERSIDYRNYGGYELMGDEESDSLQQLDTVNHWLSPLFSLPVFQMRNDLIKSFGFHTAKVKTLVFNPYESQIDTGKMMKALIRLAQKKGIQILTGSEVESLHDSGKVEVRVGADMAPITILAGKVAVCTNAFTRSLLPDLELAPGRGIVLVTHPLDNLKFKGTFHIERGYYYFRNFGKRVIFGGGRNLFPEEETSTRFEINEKILAELKLRLDEVILPGTPYEIEHTWAGIMAFGHDKQPILRKYSENIFVGARLGGMGVAIGSTLGERLAEMMVKD